MLEKWSHSFWDMLPEKMLRIFLGPLPGGVIKETDLVSLFYQIVGLNATAKVPPIDSCSERGIQWDRDEYSTEQVVQSDVMFSRQGAL